MRPLGTQTPACVYAGLIVMSPSGAYWLCERYVMPKSIVVRALNWIGDQILAYPFFHYLRQVYPAAQITVACMLWVASIQFRHLIDNVCVLPQPRSSSPWAKACALEAQAKLLRAQRPWDLGLCLPNSFASAWLLARAR